MGLTQYVFGWFYVDASAAPTAGERPPSELPFLNANTFQIFVSAFAQALSHNMNIPLLDSSGAHTA